MKKITRDHANQLRQVFAAYSADVDDEVGKAVLEAVLLVEGAAKRLFKGRDDVSIRGEPPRVQTGLLRASITHRMVRGGSEALGEVGTNVQYAKGVEYGTSKTWPHPFMRPALENNRARIILRIRKAVNAAKP